MDLVSRYVYAVTKGLPEKQRDDIEKELKTLIDDMLEQQDGDGPYEARVEKVLLDLGDPEVLADNYRESKRYLIGPQNFDNYILLLKIVLGAVLLGVSIAVGLGSIFSNEQNAAAIFTDYLAALFSGALQGFAWVTIAFAIAERKGVRLSADGKNKKTEWSIKELPAIPVKEAAISPVESIFSILFTTLFITVLYFTPQVFAVYTANNITGTTVIPIFDIAVLKGYRWLIAGIFISGILKEAAKLVAGRWTLKISAVYSALSAVSTVLTLILFSNSRIWNPHFSTELPKHFDFSFSFVNSLGHTNKGIILFILAVGIIDVAAVMYRGIKYNTVK